MTALVIGLLILSMALSLASAYFSRAYAHTSELYTDAKSKLESTRIQLRAKEIRADLYLEEATKGRQQLADLKEANGYLEDTLRHRNGLLRDCENSLEDARIECVRRGMELQQLKDSVKRKKNAKRYPEGQAGPGRPKTSAKRKPRA